MSTPVTVSAYVYIYIYISKNSLAYAEDDDCSAVRYPTGVKSAQFRSSLDASHMSSNTEELWYNKTVCL